MINLKSSEKQVMSTKAILEQFELTEEELVWYIKAARYQLANPGKMGLKYMGKPVRCMYPEKDLVEACFASVKRGEGTFYVLVALDLERVVLFVSAENLSYEIWLGFKQQGENFSFFEELYTLHMFFGRKCYGSKMETQCHSKADSEVGGE